MKIICVGRNYVEHIEELNNNKPDSPVLFLKPETSLIHKKQPFFIPSFSNEIHHEIEIIVQINRLGKSIATQYSHKYYDKIGLGIDFTARDVQSKLKEKGLPWEKAKGFDHSAVISKFIPIQNYNLSDLNFSLTKNDTLVQEGNTKQMIHNIDEIIAHVSQYFTLKIGDYIFTGTPAGVGNVNTNDHLVGKIEDEVMFDFRVK